MVLQPLGAGLGPMFSIVGCWLAARIGPEGTAQGQLEVINTVWWPYCTIQYGGF